MMSLALKKEKKMKNLHCQKIQIFLWLLSIEDASKIVSSMYKHKFFIVLLFYYILRIVKFFY